MTGLRDKTGLDFVCFVGLKLAGVTTYTKDQNSLKKQNKGKNCLHDFI